MHSMCYIYRIYIDSETLEYYVYKHSVFGSLRIRYQPGLSVFLFKRNVSSTLEELRNFEWLRGV